MIKGLDNGNTFTKDNQGRIFKSAFCYQDNTLSNNQKITIDGKDIYFGMGNSNVDVDRTESEINKICTLANIAMTGTDEYYLVVGLPIIQYKEKKDKLKETVLGYNGHEIIYKEKQVYYKIKDVEVCAQGLGALYSLEDNKEDAILFDIGSYTINVVLIEYENGIPKIVKFNTWYSGILNLYKNIIDEVNRRFDLTLEHSYAEKILKNGLTVDGDIVDILFLKPIITDYLEPIFTQFKLNYPYKTVGTLLMGGGAILLSNTVEKRFKNTMLMPDAQFANARGYFNYGLQKFDKYIKMQNMYTRR